MEIIMSNVYTYSKLLTLAPSVDRFYTAYKDNYVKHLNPSDQIPDITLEALHPNKLPEAPVLGGKNADIPRGIDPQNSYSIKLQSSTGKFLQTYLEGALYTYILDKGLKLLECHFKHQDTYLALKEFTGSFGQIEREGFIVPTIQTSLDNFVGTYITDSQIARTSAIELSSFLLAPIKAIDTASYITYNLINPYTPPPEPEILGVDEYIASIIN
jgi:hypothetical protein